MLLKGLDPTTLETAWGLSDVERDGMLTLDGIAVALAYLNVLTCANIRRNMLSLCGFECFLIYGIYGVVPKLVKIQTSPLKDLPRVLLLHSPDHQRDAWSPHAQFARRPATTTLGIADEPGTLGGPGGGEGGTSFTKLVWQCFLYFSLFSAR